MSTEAAVRGTAERPGQGQQMPKQRRFALPGLTFVLGGALLGRDALSQSVPD
jgi:hypothetical protein